MAIRRSVGCSCCSPVEKTCCSETIAKGYPSSYTNEGTHPYNWIANTYTTTDQTNWADGWTGDVPQNIIEDDPDTLDATPNTLPANSTVSYEINLCCLDYIVDVELMDIDADDDETEVRVGGMRWKAAGDNNKCNVVNGLNWKTDVGQSYNHGLQMLSMLHNGNVHDMIKQEWMSSRNPNTPLTNFTTWNQINYRYKVGPAWKQGTPRKAKVTITTGQYPVTVGSVVILTGSRLTDNGQSNPDECVEVAPTNSTTVPSRADGVYSDPISTINHDYDGYDFIYDGEVEIDGYGTVQTETTIEGVPFNAGLLDTDPTCSDQTTKPSFTVGYTHDLSGLNGIRKNILCRRFEYRTDDTIPVNIATVDELAMLDTMKTRILGGGEFFHDDEILEHWKFEWRLPLLGRIVPDNSLASCTANGGYNSTYWDFSNNYSCDGDPIPLNGSGTLSTQNIGQVNWDHSDNEYPCFSITGLTGYTFAGQPMWNERCYGTSPKAGETDFTYYYMNMTSTTPMPVRVAYAPTTTFFGCADSNNPRYDPLFDDDDIDGRVEYNTTAHPDWFNNGLDYEFYRYFEKLPVVWPIGANTPFENTFYNTVGFQTYHPEWDQPSVEDKVDEFTGSMPQKKIIQSSDTDTFSGSYQFSNGQTHAFTNSSSVTGSWTATHDANWKSVRHWNDWTDEGDHEAVTRSWKIYDGIVSEFSFSKVTRDSNLDITDSVVFTQDGASTVPTDLTLDLYDPSIFSDTYRGSSADVNDGKIYGNEVTGTYTVDTSQTPIAYSGYIGFLLHRVMTDNSNEFMIKFHEGIDDTYFKIFDVTGNEQYSFSSSNRTVTHFEGCTPSEVELISGTEGAEGDYIVVTFKISGTK